MPPFLGMLIEFGGWLGGATILFGIIWWLIGSPDKSPQSRRKIQDWLNYDTVGKGYRGLLTRALDWVDDRLCSDAERALPETDWRRGWSTQLLSYVLILAMAYPILSLLLRWTFANSGSVGGLDVLPPDDRDVVRYGTLGLIATMMGGWIYGNRAGLTRQRRLVFQLVFAGGSFVGLVLLVATQGSGSGAIAVTFAVAIAVTFAFAVTFAVAIAVAGAIAVTFAGAIAVAVAAAFAFTVAKTMERLSNDPPRPTVALGLWAFLGLVIVLVATAISPGFREQDRGTILFISLLPLINGLADFASIGLTRWSLRRGVQGLLPWSWFIDLIGAALIFLALGFSLIAFIHFIRPQDGVALIDLTTLFEDLGDKTTRGQYWWLLFTLFSTLIPTVLHFIIAALAFFTIYPAALRERIAAWLKSAPDDQIAARGGRLALSFAMTAAIVIPTLLVVETIRLWPAILNVTIGIFEGFARMIGAIA